MAYRNKTYVAFDGDRDIHYYYLMKAWRSHPSSPFNFYDAHGLRQARDTSLEASIKRSLRERLDSARVFVLLIGEGTRYLHKFVRWEIDQALSLDLPIIAVNINGQRRLDTDRCPPILRDRLAVHVAFKQSVVQYAMDHWPASHQQHKRNGEIQPYFYKSDVYRQLGL